MKIDEIVALSKAGFTAEQIAQMSAAQSQQPQQTQQTQQTQQPQQTQQTQQPQQTQQTQQPQQTQQTQQPQQTPNPIDALMQQVVNLTNIVQANAIGNTQMPTKENSDDILAAIINPPTKEAKK